MRKQILVLVALVSQMLFACGQNNKKQLSNKMTNTNQNIPTTTVNIPQGMEIATFGNGCFWCTEAIFQRLKGVQSVTSGYSGGFVQNPSYEQVCEKNTGHAEVLQIIYNPKEITFDELLEVFWKTHDPTTLNQQGADIGPQYRSVIFYHNEEQKAKAEKYKTELDAVKAFNNPIVTAIESFTNFYSAEGYHQNFYNNNPNQGYCRMVVRPKVEKFEKVFKSKLK
ncbi:MAG: peptide-methionine (S)-S-oxide reductase MsrA, partial [Chitinophagaceae bacterium]